MRHPGKSIPNQLNTHHFLSIQNFQNKCLGDKSELIDKFSVYFGINTTDFNLEYFEDETNNGIFVDTSFDFISNNTKFQFSINLIKHF